jgi:hypothetical protein
MEVYWPAEKMLELTVRFKSVPIIGSTDDRIFPWQSGGYTMTTTFNMSDVRDHILTFSRPNTLGERLNEASIALRVLWYGLILSLIIPTFCLGIVSSLLPRNSSLNAWIMVILALLLIAGSIWLTYQLVNGWYDKNRRAATAKELLGKARSDRGLGTETKLSCILDRDWDWFVSSLRPKGVPKPRVR